MAFLTRDDLFNRAPKFKDVEVDGKTVRVFKLGAREKVQFTSGFFTLDADGKPQYNGSGARARMLILACRNEQGERIFTNADAEWLENADPDVVEPLVEAAEELSGLTATADEIRELFRQART